LERLKSFMQEEQNTREKFVSAPYTDLSLYIEHPVIEALICLLDSEMQRQFKPRTRITTRDQASIALSAILANLFRASWAGRGVVAISLNRNNYSPSDGAEIGHVALKSAIEFLTSGQSVDMTYIDPLVVKHVGFQTSNGYKENTKLELDKKSLHRWISISLSESLYVDIDTIKFIEEGIIVYKSIDNYNQYNDDSNKNITPLTNTLKPIVRRRRQLSPICVMNDDDRSIEFERSPEVDRMYAHVNQYNEYLSLHAISLFLSDCEVDDLLAKTKIRLRENRRGRDFVSTLSHVKGWEKSRVHRVFNRSSFEFGGRHYGGFWQNIPKQYRPFITINGHPTVELDYASLHPTMIYHQRGLEPQGDPYLIDGLSTEYRGAIKLALLVLINAAPSARRLQSLDKLILPSGWDVPRLIKAIKAKHQIVEDAFRSDSGICLQRLDSDMAAFVIREMRIRHRALALPIHDSFIVTEDQERNLQAVMLEAYKTVMGDREIKIDRKRTLFECLNDIGEKGERAQLLRFVEGMLDVSKNSIDLVRINASMPSSKLFGSYLASFSQETETAESTPCGQLSHSALV